MSLGLKRRIVDANKTGERCKKLLRHFQVSRTGMRSIIKKLKESDTLQNKTA